MKYSASYKNEIPVGFASETKSGPGMVSISACRLLTSSDGEDFVKRIEDLTNKILYKTDGIAPVMPHAIHNLFVVIAPEGQAEVYVNEMDMVGLVRIKGEVKEGDYITKNQILDYGRFKLDKIQIPDNCGFYFLVTVGWRRALYYDFRKFVPKIGPVDPYDVGKLLGSVYSYLTFYSRFSMTDAVWSSLTDSRWFPFSYLDDHIVERMIDSAKNKHPVDNLLPDIKSCIDLLLTNNHPNNWPEIFYNEHRALITQAIDRYSAEDYISCVSILYPRLEGIMRTFMRHQGDTTKPTADKLAKFVSEANSNSRNGLSVLFPNRFRDYLSEVFFAHFTPGSNPDAGRHSVAHGEAKESSFDLKSACIAILVLFQSRLLLTDGRKITSGLNSP